MLTVRPFCLDDVAPANALTNWYIQHTAVHFGDRPATDSEFEAAWRAGSATHPWFSAWWAGDEQASPVRPAFAGYIKAGVWRERAAYSRTCETGVYVARGMEGRGVGTALYQALLAELRERGFHTVVAGMTLPNDASQRLHERVGFTKVGEFSEVGYKLGRWHDTGFWQMRL